MAFLFLRNATEPVVFIGFLITLFVLLGVHAEILIIYKIQYILS